MRAESGGHRDTLLGEIARLHRRGRVERVRRVGLGGGEIKDCLIWALNWRSETTKLRRPRGIFSAEICHW